MSARPARRALPPLKQVLCALKTEVARGSALPSAHVLTAVAFVPTPPLLVPELAGAAAVPTRDLRDACARAVRVLAGTSRSWTAIGAHGTDIRLGPDAGGSWACFGADVGVSLGPHLRVRPAAELPLAALIAGWLRELVAPEAEVRLRLYAHDTAPARCLQQGQLLAADPQPRTLLVLGDGCTTLTQKAPGAFDGRAAAVQDQIDAALSTVDCAALGALDPALCRALGVSGRVPWQIAAGAVRGIGWRAHSLYRGAPFGVGYHVATWLR